jgi:hypothetical protein
MRVAGLAGLLMAGGAVAWAQGGAREGSEAWYPKDAADVVPGFTAGRTGKPFSGTATWFEYGRTGEMGDYYTRPSAVALMRDASGRERLQWTTAASDLQIPGAAGTSTVLVLDPVAGCVFLWLETADAKGVASGKVAGEARVRCEPKGVTPAAEPAWDALEGWEQADLKKEPASKPHFVNEPMGGAAGAKKAIGGVEANGFRRYEVRTFDKGTRVQKDDFGQRWYAPSLDMVVLATEGEHTNYFDPDPRSFTLTGIRLGEPPAEAFRPPAGAAIEVDERLAVRWQEGSPQGMAFMAPAPAPGPVGAWPDVDSAGMTRQAVREAHPVFRAEWYPKDASELVPGMYAGRTGLAFATGAEMYEDKPDSTGEMEAEESMTATLARDSQGRVRVAYGYKPPSHGMYRSEVIGSLVYVIDPVSHCMFSWFDGSLTPKPPTAKVRCSGKAATLPPSPGWEEPVGEEKDEIAKALATGAGTLRFVDVKTGEDVVNGVAAVVYRRYAVTTEAGGRETRKDVGGRWYVASLDEVVKATQMLPKAKGKKPEDFEMFEMYGLRPRESDTEFYPPRGYVILVDQTLLPPSEQGAAKK